MSFSFVVAKLQCIHSAMGQHLYHVRKGYFSIPVWADTFHELRNPSELHGLKLIKMPLRGSINISRSRFSDFLFRRSNTYRLVI